MSGPSAINTLSRPESDHNRNDVAAQSGGSNVHIGDGLRREVSEKLNEEPEKVGHGNAPTGTLEDEEALEARPAGAALSFSAALPLPRTSSSTESGLKTSTESSAGHGETEKEIDVEAQAPLGHKEEETDSKRQREGNAETDPDLVHFDGPDDPLNARNWTSRRKWSNIAIIASITFLTPLASSMFAPGVPEVMRDFHASSVELASFVVSVYILGYAAGPIVLAPLSELYGRMPLYHACNVGFVIFTIACAVSSNLNMLIGFRFVEGLFGSCPLTIGGGTIADMFVQEKRGTVMAIWTLGPLMGPVIGPVAGGYLAEAQGWRWAFWVIAIAAGVLSILGIFCIQETYPVVILERKAKRLRKETGNMNLRSEMALPYTPTQLFKISIVRPLKMLIFSPIVFLLSLYVAIVYGYLYLLFTTLTPVFESAYRFSPSSVGLSFLGIGIGSLLGLIIFGILSDGLLKYLTRTKGNGVSKPEYRLPPLIPGSLVLPLGLFLYGWTAQHADTVHWIGPIIGTGLVGFGLLAAIMPVQTYLVDAYTTYAASALAANTILRSLMGALLPLGGQRMYESLGLGWGNSLLGFIALACVPIPIVFYLYGERIRKSKSFQLEF